MFLRIFFLSFFAILNVKNDQQSETYSFVDEEFASHPFGTSLLPQNIESVSKKKFTIDRRAIVNKHSGEMDSLLIYKSGDSEFYFYKSNAKTFLQKASIMDSFVKLGRGVQTGQLLKSINFLFKKNAPKATQTIVITDEEEYASHKFFFEKGVLRKIEINMGID
jgi:hypothetical protein